MPIKGTFSIGDHITFMPSAFNCGVPKRCIGKSGIVIHITSIRYSSTDGNILTVALDEDDGSGKGRWNCYEKDAKFNNKGEQLLLWGDL